MDRQSSITSRTTELFPAALVRELLPALVAASIAAQCLIGIGLVARRVSGAVSVTAAPGWTVAWVLGAAVVAAATRAVWFAVRRSAPTVVDSQVLCVPTLALLLTVLSLSTVGMPLIPLMSIWSIVVGEEALILLFIGACLNQPPASLMRIWRRGPVAQGPWRDRKHGLRSGRQTLGARDSMAPDVQEATAIKTRRSPALPAPSDRTSQCIERVQTASGSDRLAGTLMTYFAPGQTTAYVHVAFCPPFVAVPRVEYRQTGDPAARVKVGQVLPHGIRFDVKLYGPAPAPVQLVLEVRATIESGDAPPPAEE
jgi:hypothetical protein